jgi:3-hydroxybutyryl-CoA dehydrogenase
MRREAAVVGAGTMGAGIALLAARHGLGVRLVARSRPSLDGALARIRDTLDFLTAEGELTPAAGEQALARVSTTTDLAAALRGADLVLEAVSEDAGTKRAVYVDIGAQAGPAALVASTTSGLDIFALAPDFPAPERLLIAHFWNPPYLVPLVEVVPGPATSREIVAETEALLRAWGCVPVTLTRYVPGFIGVRLNSALYREAVDLIEHGITSAAGIDAVMRESIALRFPVLDVMEVADFGGLDTFSRVWEHMFPAISAVRELPPGVRRAVAGGALGLKSGRGFYDYRGRSAAALLRERDRRLLRWLRERDRYRLAPSAPLAAAPAPGPAAGATVSAGRRQKIAGPEFGLRTGAFSNGYTVEVAGAAIVHTAGHLAVDAEGNVVGGGDTARQAEFIYGVIERILAAAGASLDDVVKTTAYLTDIRDYPAVNTVRNTVFAGREPASTMVEVTKLVHPLAKIEIEAVAIHHRK